MLAFFYSLFLAIATGTWQLHTLADVNNALSDLLNRTGSLVINAFGGRFEVLQTFVWLDNDLTAANAFAAVSAIIALGLLCALTYKLVRMVFSIFFGGR